MAGISKLGCNACMASCRGPQLSTVWVCQYASVASRLNGGTGGVAPSRDLVLSSQSLWSWTTDIICLERTAAWFYTGLVCVFSSHQSTQLLSVGFTLHMSMCVYCTCVWGPAWVCLPLAQVGVYLSWCFYCLCIRADRMCGVCQHASRDERLERVWK